MCDRERAEHFANKLVRGALQFREGCTAGIAVNALIHHVVNNTKEEAELIAAMALQKITAMFQLLGDGDLLAERKDDGDEFVKIVCLSRIADGEKICTLDLTQAHGSDYYEVFNITLKFFQEQEEVDDGKGK